MNARLHYYLGLYLLLFVWLFAFTGLLLNHGSWAFAEFWSRRKTFVTEHRIDPFTATSNVEAASRIMTNIGIAGDIQWLTTAPGPDRLEFRATRPGRQYEIKADLAGHRARVERTELNTWGVLRTLHTFTGVRLNDPANTRDWMLTSLWAWSMDAVALGLIVVSASGIIIWLQSGPPRPAGWFTLAAGIVACGWFLAGVTWLGS